MTTQLATVRCQNGRAVATVYADDHGARRIRIERLAYAEAEPSGWRRDPSRLHVDERLDALADGPMHTIPATCGCGRNVTVQTRAVRAAVAAGEESITVPHPERRRRPRRPIVCEADRGVAGLHDDRRTGARSLHRIEHGVPVDDALDALTDPPRVVCACGRPVTLDLAVIRVHDAEPSTDPIQLPHDA